MATTLADVFAAGRIITKANMEDYSRFPEGYTTDSNTRRAQRCAAHRARRDLVLSWDTIVPPGDYGRIEITKEGKIYYCAGQYAMTEYYFHVEQLCRVIARLRELSPAV